MDRYEPSLESRYRAGERSPQTRRAKADADKRRRREKAAETLPPAKRKGILKAVAQGMRLTQAAREAGTTTQAVYRLAEYDPAWASALDAAQRAAAPADCPHGTPNGYRWYRCRCAACRTAKDGPLPSRKPTAGRPSAERLRAEMETRAVRLGYPGLEDLIRRTRHLGAGEVGRLVGRSQRTVSYWRREILGAPQSSDGPRRQSMSQQRLAWEQRRAGLAEAAGFSSWEEAISETASMPLRHAASRLNTAVSTVAYWRGLSNPADVAGRAESADAVAEEPPSALDAAAVSHGYSGLEDLICSTASLPRPQVARMLRCDGDTVTRWRRKTGVQPPRGAGDRPSPTAAGMEALREAREARARQAGYSSWEEAITATAPLSLAAAARVLGAEKATVLYWRRKPRTSAGGDGK